VVQEFVSSSCPVILSPGANGQTCVRHLTLPEQSPEPSACARPSVRASFPNSGSAALDGRCARHPSGFQHAQTLIRTRGFHPHSLAVHDDDWRCRNFGPFHVPNLSPPHDHQSFACFQALSSTYMNAFISFVSSEKRARFVSSNKQAGVIHREKAFPVSCNACMRGTGQGINEQCAYVVVVAFVASGCVASTIMTRNELAT
jgi:hypothetical protein